MTVIDFKLPWKLPRVFPSEERFSRIVIKQGINHIFSKHWNEVEQEPIVDFFRAMTRDVNWMTDYSKVAQQVTTAVENIFRRTKDLEIQEDISYLFLENHAVLSRYLSMPPRILVEEVLCDKVTCLNTEIFLKLAGRYNLENLQDASLAVLFYKIDLNAVSEWVKGNDELIRTCCLNWLLDKLPEAMKVLGENVFSLYEPSKIEAQRLLKKFCEVAHLYRHVNHPALSRFSKRDLFWVIDKFPDTLETLDLFGCCIGISELSLVRFKNLTTIFR